MKLIPFFSAFAAAQRIETSKMREFNSGVRQGMEINYFKIFHSSQT